MLLFDGGAERMEPAIRVIIIRTSAVMAFVFFVGISFRPVNSFDVLSEGTGILGTENRIRDWEWGLGVTAAVVPCIALCIPGFCRRTVCQWSESCSGAWRDLRHW